MKRAVSSDFTGPAPKRGMPWQNVLLKSMDDPNLRILEDDKVVVIKDAFPKAKHHLLVICKQKELNSIKDLKKENVQLVEYMEKIGKSTAERVGYFSLYMVPEVPDCNPIVVRSCAVENHSKYKYYVIQICRYGEINEFQFGYHSIPSLSRLHLHVISTDFDSICLKTKKHWNSFTTDFFLHSKDVISQLRENGSVTVSETAKERLIDPLKCHRCSTQISNIPQLKKHISQCNVTKEDSTP